MLTDALIPTNGIWITRTYYPAGYQVARYGAEGFTSDIRWFPCIKMAQRYASTLRAR